MIVIDWGTTNLRAYLCDRDGRILSVKSSQRGIKSLSRADYPAVLGELLAAEPFAGDIGPVFISGMAGSRNGWIEVPYFALPAGLDALRQGLLPLPEPFSGYIIPGARVLKQDGSSDVMRGEEIQIYGALRQLGLTDALLCLPGTHSKWVQASKGEITDFSTFMTGDVFQALGQTILGCSVAAEFDRSVFERGLDAAADSRGGLLHQLFMARTLMLDGHIHAEQVSSYVSGLLLGHEIKSALCAYPSAQSIVVIGSSQLCHRYRLALEKESLAVLVLESDVATCQGVAALV